MSDEQLTHTWTEWQECTDDPGVLSRSINYDPPGRTGLWFLAEFSTGNKVGFFMIKGVWVSEEEYNEYVAQHARYWEGMPGHG